MSRLLTRLSTGASAAPSNLYIFPLFAGLSRVAGLDSNRGHHDFQLGRARSPLFLTAQKSAWITGSCIVHEHHCSPLTKLGCRHNCRQWPEKAILRTLLDVVLQFQRKSGADERTRTSDLISLRVIGQGLQGFAGGCKYRKSKGLSFPCLAACCTVLLSRWYQNGISRPPVMHRGRYTTSGPSIFSLFPECEETLHLWIATLTGYRLWADMPPKGWTKRLG